MLRSLLLISIIVQSYIFYISFRKLRKKDFHSIITPLLFLIGAFVWEDALIISFFWIIGGIILFFLNSWNFTLILLLLFIIIRKFIEVIYWLFQQFNNTGFRPYDFGFKNLNNNSIYIIYQMFSFCIVVLSLFLLIIIL